jgi:hypothetical protein
MTRLREIYAGAIKSKDRCLENHAAFVALPWTLNTHRWWLPNLSVMLLCLAWHPLFIAIGWLTDKFWNKLPQGSMIGVDWKKLHLFFLPHPTD